MTTLLHSAPLAHSAIHDRDGSLWTAAQVVERFGPIPIWRVASDPPPGTATESDVCSWEERTNRLFELVDGVLVEKVMGSYESLLAVEIAGVLMSFVKPGRLGWVLGADGMLRLWPGRIRIPDVCFVSRQQCPDGRFPRGASIASLFPDLAVEVLSASNTREEMDEKLRDYFQAGARLVWYIDPASQSAEAFTAPDCRSAIPPNGTLTGDPVLPGFTVPLAALFAVDLTENTDA